MRNKLFRSALLLVLAAIAAYGISFILNFAQPIPGIEFKVFNPLKVFLPDVTGEENPFVTSDSLNTGKMSESDSLLFAHIKKNTQVTDSIKAEPDTLPTAPLHTVNIDEIPLGITDYSASGTLLTTIQSGLSEASARPFNIAFLGDSFIEGDILVERFRNQLQQTYGGMGVGFVPLTSTTARFRHSVKHRFSGQWERKSVLSAKHHLNLLLSGGYEIVSGKASVTYGTIKAPANLSEFEQAVLLYESKAPIQVDIQTNGSEERNSMILEGEADRLSKAVLAEGGHLHSIQLHVTDSAAAHLHGMLLTGKSGVNVDNYSLRGASGLQLVGVSSTLARQLNAIHPYHLIILSYGLNVVSDKENHDSYNWYFKSMGRAIAHIKEVFPEAVIMIMSISDRATIVRGEVRTLSGVERLLQQQHLLAQKYGCLFFNTYGTMKKLGGISTFVDNGWAAKDYTHLSSAGGNRIADALYKSLTSTNHQEP